MLIIAKDKIIGLCIMIVGVFIAGVYTLGSVVDLFMQSRLGGSNDSGFEVAFLTGLLGFDLFDWRLFVVAPIWLLIILISIIAIWIGYSMLTTPAPVPLEELEEELAAEEAAESD